MERRAVSLCIKNGRNLLNRFKLPFIIFIACLGFIFTPNLIANQNTTLPSENYQGSWWVNLGTGVGSVNNGVGDEIAFNASANYIVAPHILLTAQTLNRGDFFFSDFTQYSALISYIKKQPRWYVSVGAGLGIDRANCYTFIVSGSSKYYISFPAQIQAFFTPSKYIGIGMILTSTVNRQYVSGTAMLAIQFGNLLV